MRVFGWVAGVLSALHNFPQLWHVYRRKSAKDISAWALVVRMVSLGFYITHGVLIEDLPLTVMSSFIFLQCVVLCVLKYYFHVVTFINAPQVAQCVQQVVLGADQRVARRTPYTQGSTEQDTRGFS